VLPLVRSWSGTVIVRPTTVIFGRLPVTYPASCGDVEGGVQPFGTVNVTAPPFTPPLSAWYVNVRCTSDAPFATVFSKP
jgi:hypothetical protein